MPNFNKTMLMGNITRDIEIRHTGGNVAVGNFGMAVNRKYKTQSGEQREEVLFVDCEAWGKTAEIISQYLSKGDPVFVEGRLKLDQWQDKSTGSKRSKISVVVESFQFISGAGEGGGTGQQRQSGQTTQSQNSYASQGGHSDIPF